MEIGVKLFQMFSNIFNLFKSFFFSSHFFIEIGGSHLSKQVREAISCTNQCMPSLYLFMVPSYDEKTVFKKCEFNDY
mgnify:CR=1 FL=1